jgi:hypothetical protein
MPGATVPGAKQADKPPPQNSVRTTVGPWEGESAAKTPPRFRMAGAGCWR